MSVPQPNPYAVPLVQLRARAATYHTTYYTALSIPTIVFLVYSLHAASVPQVNPYAVPLVQLRAGAGFLGHLRATLSDLCGSAVAHYIQQVPSPYRCL